MTAETSNARGEWLQSGGLLYRLTDERHPQNCDEINVTMADGSRDNAARAARASEILALLTAPPPAAARGDVRGLGQSVVAGALFDFLGFLTTLDNPVRLGATCEATVALELLFAWAAKRSLSLDEAAVKGWREALAAEGVQAEPNAEARGVVDEGSRSVTRQLLHWGGVPVHVTGTVTTSPGNWTLIDAALAAQPQGDK